MRFEKNNMLLSVLIVLCTVSLTLAIKISKDILENKSISTYGYSEDIRNEISQKNYRFKLEEYDFIYNGKALTEKALVASDKVLFPIDYLLKKNNIKYKIIDSDDVLSFYLDEMEYKIEIGKDKALLPFGKSLEVWSTFKDGHIYCESDILKNISEFNVRRYEDNKSIFLNCNTLYGKMNFNIIKSSTDGNEIVALGKLMHEELENKKEISIFKDVKTVYSESYKKYFYIGENYVYDLNDKQKYNTIAKFSITEDGKNFYYINEKNDHLVFLSIECEELYRFKNISSKIGTTQLSQKKVYSFTNESKLKKAIFINSKKEMDSAIIERSKDENKYVNYIDLNPDKNKMIYLDGGELYLIDIVGHGDYKIYENVNRAKWITNDKIIFTVDKEKYVYSLSKGVKESVYNDLRYLGKLNNIIYYKSDNSVMILTDGKTKEIINTQINIKDIIPLTKDNGLIIIPDSSSDSIYQYYKGELKRIGMKSKNKLIEANPLRFVSLSPDESKVVIIEMEDNFSTLNIVDINDDTKNFRIVADFQEKELDLLKIEWLDAENFVCYSDSKLYLINAIREDKIFTWSDRNSKIEGVMLK